MSYEGPWRNRMHHNYTQYCYPHEAPEKLRRLIEIYGCCFDSQWYYKLCGKSVKVITRRPLWLDRGEGGWLTEKASHGSR